MAEEVAGQRCTDAHSPAVQDLLALQGLPDLQAPASGLASPACFESAPAYLRFNSHFSLHLSCSLTWLYITVNLNHLVPSNNTHMFCHITSHYMQSLSSVSLFIAGSPFYSFNQPIPSLGFKSGAPHSDLRIRVNDQVSKTLDSFPASSERCKEIIALSALNNNLNCNVVDLFFLWTWILIN